jgi:serine/threonine protein kinase
MSVGTRLLPDRYTGAQLVGRGGMGEIYRATDTMLGRIVAVKVLDRRFAQDESVRKRFTREALAAARLSDNPNIVTVYDVGEWREQPFIVMEYVSGGSLEHRLREEGAQSPAQVLDWLEQAARALDAAHREGVVHRDVKPANLLLDRHGRIHVADFGIASAAGTHSLTQTGTVLGTAAYLSPEQAQGERATAASDRYALAVVGFELLTGRRPFEADSVAAEAAAHVTASVPSVSELVRGLPVHLDSVFARALAKDPQRRYESCAELVAALRTAFEDAAGTTAVLARTAAQRPRSPSRWLWPIAGLLVLAAAGGALGGALLAGGNDKGALPPQRASVSVKTVTQPGTTVRQTVTAPPPTTAPTTTGATTAATDPHALNDQAWAYMQQGNYQAALPLLEQAVQALQGQTADVYDAYANYNLGVVLIQVGRCAEALPYLQTALQLEPDSHEVRRALKDAEHCGD